MLSAGVVAWKDGTEHSKMIDLAALMNWIESSV